MHKHAHKTVNNSLHRDLTEQQENTVWSASHESFSYFSNIKTYILLDLLKCLLLHTVLPLIRKHIKEVNSQVQVVCIKTHQLENPAKNLHFHFHALLSWFSSMQTDITRLLRKKTVQFCGNTEFPPLRVEERVALGNETKSSCLAGLYVHFLVLLSIL